MKLLDERPHARGHHQRGSPSLWRAPVAPVCRNPVMRRVALPAVWPRGGATRGSGGTPTRILFATSVDYCHCHVGHTSFCPGGSADVTGNWFWPPWIN